MRDEARDEVDEARTCPGVGARDVAGDARRCCFSACRGVGARDAGLLKVCKSEGPGASRSARVFHTMAGAQRNTPVANASGQTAWSQPHASQLTRPNFPPTSNQVAKPVQCERTCQPNCRRAVTAGNLGARTPPLATLPPILLDSTAPQWTKRSPPGPRLPTHGAWARSYMHSLSEWPKSEPTNIPAPPTLQAVVSTQARIRKD